MTDAKDAAPAPGPHGPAVGVQPYTLEEWDREETQDDGTPLPRGWASLHPAVRYDEEDPRLRATVAALDALKAAVAEERERVRQRIRHELYGRFPCSDRDEFLATVDLG